MATVIVVPTDFSEVQNALDAAVIAIAPDNPVTVKIRAGTYPLLACLIVGGDGYPGAPIKICSYSGLNDVIFTVVPGETNDFGVSNDRNWIWLKDLTFDGGGISLGVTPPSAVYIGAGDCYGCRVENVVVKNILEGPGFFVHNRHPVEFINCTAQDCGGSGFHVTSDSSTTPFSGCLALRCGLGGEVGYGADGFYFNNGGIEGALLENCAAVACFRHGICFDYTFLFEFQPLRLAGCVLALNGKDGLHAEGGVNELQLRLFNNIFSGNSEYDINIITDGSNIGPGKWWDKDGPCRAIRFADHNCYWDTGLGILHLQNEETGEGRPAVEESFTYLPQLQAYSGQDVHSMTADPMFVSVTPGSEDIRLRAGSPCINAGGGTGMSPDVFGRWPPDPEHPAIGSDYSRDVERDRGWPLRRQVEKDVAYGPRMLTKGTLVVYGTPVYVNLTNKTLWLRRENGSLKTFAPGNYTMESWYERYVGEGKLTRLRV